MSIGQRCLFVIVLLASHGAARAEDWPQFRGPRGDSVARDVEIPREWSEAANVLWKVPLPGRGWSQPITFGDKVFVTSAVSEQEEKPRRHEGGIVLGALDARQHDYQWKLVCLDASSGAVLWDQTPYAGKPRFGKHRSNTFASESPATDGEVVIAYFGMTGIAAYDFSGEQLWKQDLGAFPMQAGWGTGSSPVIHGETVFVQCDNEKQSFLVALDKRTGNEQWRKARDEQSNWSTPYLWKNNQRTELVAAGGKKMRSYDPASGALLWEMDAAGRASASPVGNDELLLVDSAHRLLGSPARLAAIRAGAGGDISLKGKETSGPFVAWSVGMNTYRNTSPLLDGDCVYMLQQHQGILHCYDVNTGKVNFQQRIPEAAGFTASPWVAGGSVCCLDETGKTFVLERGPKFHLLATNRLDENLFWASPAFSTGRLFIRSMEALYCIGDKAVAVGSHN